MSTAGTIRLHLSASQVNEDHSPDHDRIVSWAASIPSDRLVPFEKWIQAKQPTGDYTGPVPTYSLRFDWTKEEALGPAGVINEAMDDCFGLRTFPGWGIWIRGDQLNLVIKDFRTELAKLLNAGAETGLLDGWATSLMQELERM